MRKSPLWASDGEVFDLAQPFGSAERVKIRAGGYWRGNEAPVTSQNAGHRPPNSCVMQPVKAPPQVPRPRGLAEALAARRAAAEARAAARAEALAAAKRVRGRRTVPKMVALVAGVRRPTEDAALRRCGDGDDDDD